MTIKIEGARENNRFLAMVLSENERSWGVVIRKKSHHVVLGFGDDNAEDNLKLLAEFNMDESDLTVGEAATERYGIHAKFDTALPQSWVDSCRDRGHEVRGNFVWLYDFSYAGVPAPITPKGDEIAMWLAATVE